MENSLYCNTISGNPRFLKSHWSITAVPCAKFCNDQLVLMCMGARVIFCLHWFFYGIYSMKQTAEDHPIFGARFIASGAMIQIKNAHHNSLNKLRPQRNGRNLANDIFTWVILKEKNDLNLAETCWWRKSNNHYLNQRWPIPLTHISVTSFWRSVCV